MTHLVADGGTRRNCCSTLPLLQSDYHGRRSDGDVAAFQCHLGVRVHIKYLRGHVPRNQLYQFKTAGLQLYESMVILPRKAIANFAIAMG